MQNIYSMDMRERRFAEFRLFFFVSMNWIFFFQFTIFAHFAQIVLDLCRWWIGIVNWKCLKHNFMLVFQSNFNRKWDFRQFCFHGQFFYFQNFWMFLMFSHFFGVSSDFSVFSRIFQIFLFIHFTAQTKFEEKNF